MWVKTGVKRKLNTKSLRIRGCCFCLLHTAFCVFSFSIHTCTNPPTNPAFPAQQRTEVERLKHEKSKNMLHFVIDAKSKYCFRLKWHSSASVDPCTDSVSTLLAHTSYAEHYTLAVSTESEMRSHQRSRKLSSSAPRRPVQRCVGYPRVLPVGFSVPWQVWVFLLQAQKLEIG